MDLPLTPVFLAAVVASYLLGAIPFGLVLVKLFRRQDVRAEGSGNIGATNVTRVAGRALGAATLVLDALKGWAPVMVGGALGLDALACAVLGSAAFLGHCFPVYLRFHGGKGIATGLGVIAGVQPLAAVVAIAVFLVAFVVSRISSLSCIAGLVAVGVLGAFQGAGMGMLGLYSAMGMVSLYKLMPNIKRILGGQELKF